LGQKDEDIGLMSATAPHQKWVSQNSTDKARFVRRNEYCFQTLLPVSSGLGNQVPVEMGGVGLRWLEIGWDREQVQLRLLQARSSSRWRGFLNFDF